MPNPHETSDLTLLNRFLRRVKTRTGVAASIATVCVGILFFKLGLWQLDRADEKTAILETHRAAMERPSLTELTASDAKEQLYRRVRLNGRYDQSRQFLLDNRIVSGQPGFEVITAFFVAEDQYILVNRGWIGHSGDRKVSLVEDPDLTAESVLEGILTTPSRGFTLGNSVSESVIDPVNPWPVIIQFIDYETIAAKLDKIPAVEAVVIASAGQAGNYRYNWQPVASGAEKHLGYAFQWFAMLLALSLLYLYLMVLKKQDE